MEYTLVINIWLLFILLALSAFFSSSETALFSLGSLALERIKVKGHKSYKCINVLLAQPRRTLISILVGNEFVNNSFSVVMAYVVYKLFEGKVSAYFLPIIPVIFSWPILVILGEIVPKTIAVRSPDRLSHINSIPLHYFSKLIYPLRIVVKAIVDVIARPFLGKKGKQDSIIDEDFFKEFVEMGREEGLLDEEEKELIDRVFVLDDIYAEQIMTPYDNVAGIKLKYSYKKLIDFIKKERFSRIPVLNENQDKIIGILNIKDLVGFKYSEENAYKNFLKRNIKTPIFISPKIKIIDLLKDFQLRRTHMGIVIDEKEKVLGIVTLEDVLEELFGEIKDEYDIEETFWKKIPGGSFSFDMRITALRFSELLDYKLPSGDFHTLEELLSNILGHNPVSGEEIINQRFKIKIVKHTNRLRALVTILDEADK